MSSRAIHSMLLICAALAGCGGEREPAAPAGAASGGASVPEASRPATPVPPAPADARVLFGDLHIHTSFSPDAFSVGNRTLPDDAYRFAKGEQTQHAAGYPIRLKRALDFAAVTDHSEYMGVLPQLADPSSPLSKLELAGRFKSADPAQAQAALQEVVKTLNTGKPMPELVSPEITGSVWGQIVEAANRHYVPGSFTTLVGYEWTSTIDGDNLHRNVLFRSDKVPAAPFTSFDSPDPEKLWAWLEQHRAAGIESIAVPHNQNASNGRMFGTQTFDGRALDADYVARRLRNEPVHEIVQIKGQSEVHPDIASYDEFAQFEIFPITLKMGDAPTMSRVPGSYVREALGVGLELGANGPGNPYHFGFIGSSDSHNSSSPVEEDNYHGKLPLSDGTPEQRIGPPQGNNAMRGLGRIFSAAGLAAVWATENTREAVFDALRRGETYATSGTRIRLRVFGGWAYEQALLADPAYAQAAYAGGVAMGGDLPPRPAAAAGPRLLIRAAKDPEGANLDRVQVIKGWLGADGRHQERIFEVSWAGERVLDPVTGKLPAIGSTVDVAQASYQNSIGAAQLDTLWSDPEFDPAQPAFYYVRVLEIPTPRWSTFDAKKLGIEAPQPQTLQERAYSSPIWYTPVKA